MRCTNTRVKRNLQNRVNLVDLDDEEIFELDDDLLSYPSLKK
jgi:hypothetical protein